MDGDNSLNIQKFVCTDPGNDFEAMPVEFELPEWINPNHPDFPKYFQFASYNKDWVVTSWFERRPN